jgi:hypothetical protein
MTAKSKTSIQFYWPDSGFGIGVTDDIKVPAVGDLVLFLPTQHGGFDEPIQRLRYWNDHKYKRVTKVTHQYYISENPDRIYHDVDNAHIVVHLEDVPD